MANTNDNIRSWMGAHLLTGVQFAEMIEMPYDTFKSKIAGKTDWKLDEVIKILDVTGCEFSELFRPKN